MPWIATQKSPEARFSSSSHDCSFRFLAIVNEALRGSLKRTISGPGCESKWLAWKAHLALASCVVAFVNCQLSSEQPGLESGLKPPVAQTKTFGQGLESTGQPK